MSSLARTLAYCATLVVVTGIQLACEDSAAKLPPPAANAVEVTLVTDPPGAAVMVDSVPVGTGPVTLKLNPGPHRLRAAMNAYFPMQEQRVQVGEAEPRSFTLSLVKSH